MYLNDAFDVEFDKQHRKERPIPSGAISLKQVWIMGALWLLLGIGLLAPHSIKSAILTLLLVGAILLYDALHKLVAFSPVLMALCRFLLILLAASFGQFEIDGLAIWSGLVLAGYIVGLSYIARRESIQGVIGFWPLVPMAAPIILAFIVNAGPYRDAARLLSLVLVLWVLKSLKPLWLAAQRNIGQVVSHLLAGICLVDLLSVADVPRSIGLLFLGFFGLSLLFQRFIPAT
jgi:4-hydroxybenzoate polyprenyltransferase